MGDRPVYKCQVDLKLGQFKCAARQTSEQRGASIYVNPHRRSVGDRNILIPADNHFRTYGVAKPVIR